jgi:hypothetical protein
MMALGCGYAANDAGVGRIGRFGHVRFGYRPVDIGSR